MTPLSAAERQRFASDSYLVREALLSDGQCDELCERLSGIIALEATRLSTVAKPELSFFGRFARSQSSATVLWDERSAALVRDPASAERVVMRVGHGLHLVDDRFARALRTDAIGGVLAALVGEDARLLQSAVIYKQPHSDAVQFGPHQDSWYLTTEPDTLVMAFVALDDMDAERGCLEVVPGSHTHGRLARLAIGEAGFVEVEAPPHGQLEGLARRPIPMRRGDVLFAHGRTIHASGPNRSPHPRRALIVHACDGASRLLSNTWLTPPTGGFPSLASFGTTSDRPASAAESSPLPTSIGAPP